MALTDLIPFRKERRRGESLPVRRDPDNPFLRLQDEMNRLFDDFLPAPFRGRSDLMRFPDGDWGFMPDVDVRETKKNIQVTAELPGVDEKDLDVRLDGNMLTIRGEKRDEKTEKEGTWTRSECCYGSFVRSIPIAAEVDPDRVEATFRKGVLKVTLPKAKPEAADTGRIKVKAG
jgi:HSP20 family protein